jgi:hypothetical protein
MQPDDLGVASFTDEQIQTLAGPAGTARSVQTKQVTSDILAADFIDLMSQPIPSGFQWLRLDELKLDEVLAEVKSAEDYRPHATYEDMQSGLQKLREKVLPAIAAQGYAADSFMFSQMDRQAGVKFEDGSQKIFEAFFGDDAIAVQLDPITGKYDVSNGRHRIRAAVDSGWLALPVKNVRRKTL